MGVVAGLAGTVIMTQFQNTWSKATEELKNGREANGQSDGGHDQENSGQQEKEDATMKAAGKVIELTGNKPSHEQKKKGGPIVHYVFGALQGGVYGTVLALAKSRGGIGAGTIFGASLFIAADELALPAVGLSGNPADSPISSHLYGLASHLVYGIGTEYSRKLLRAMI